MSNTVAWLRFRRWITYAVCAWAVLFAAPHAWWALGVPAGFPGGRASYDFFMASTWRYVFDLVVIALSGLTVVIALVLLRPPGQIARRWIPLTTAWVGTAMLLLRGLAGMVVDGVSDPIWWPTFLTGGVLLGMMSWSAQRDREPIADP